MLLPFQAGVGSAVEAVGLDENLLLCPKDQTHGSQLQHV